MDEIVSLIPERVRLFFKGNEKLRREIKEYEGLIPRYPQGAEFYKKRIEVRRKSLARRIFRRG